MCKTTFFCCILHDKCCKDTFEVILGVARKMLFILDNTLSWLGLWSHENLQEKKFFCNATSAFYVISHGWKFNGKSFCSSSGAFSYLLLLENLPLIAVRSKRCDVDIICIPKIEVSKNTHCWKITQNVSFQFL